jgi:ADP-ribose pyrophosphatase
MDLTERLIKSDTIYAGKLVQLRVDRVQVPGGTEVIREVVVHPGSVGMVPLLPGGQVVLIRQYRHAVGKTLCEMPAGTLRPDEDPEACARRELAEEIGQEAEEMEFLFSIYLTPGYCNELMHVYAARGLRPAAGQPEPDERIEVVTMPFDDALAMIERGEIQHAPTVCGLLAVARRKDRAALGY